MPAVREARLPSSLASSVSYSKPFSNGSVAAALTARDRTACGQVAPPQGLYLVRVEY